MSNVTAVEAASLLGWLAAAGVDTLVGDTPRNWLAAPPPRPTVAPAIRDAVRVTAAPVAPQPGPANDVAAAITDLAGLDAALASFAHPLRNAAPPQLLTGNIASGLIILGDQPLLAGSPEARLAERMLAAIGLDVASCARAHLLPWSSGRPPRDAEIAAYAPFRTRAFALAAPRFILAFGDKAAALSGETRGVAALRGRWHAIAGVPMLATFPPARLLAQPDLKRLAWADLQAFAARIRS